MGSPAVPNHWSISPNRSAHGYTISPLQALRRPISMTAKGFIDPGLLSYRHNVCRITQSYAPDLPRHHILLFFQKACYVALSIGIN